VGAACAAVNQRIAARNEHGQLFGVCINALLPPPAATSTAATPTAAAGAAATRSAATERALLTHRPALCAPLSKLTGLAAAVHVTKRAARTLRACEALAAGSRPLAGPAGTPDATRAAKPTRTPDAARAARTTRPT